MRIVTFIFAILCKNCFMNLPIPSKHWLFGACVISDWAYGSIFLLNQLRQQLKLTSMISMYVYNFYSLQQFPRAFLVHTFSQKILTNEATNALMIRWLPPRWISRTLTVLPLIKRKAVRRTPIGVPPPAMKRCLIWMKLRIRRIRWMERLERQCQRPKKNMKSLRQSRHMSGLPNFKWPSASCSVVLDVNLWWVSMALQLQLRSCF